MPKRKREVVALDDLRVGDEVTVRFLSPTLRADMVCSGQVKKLHPHIQMREDVTAQNRFINPDNVTRIERG